MAHVLSCTVMLELSLLRNPNGIALIRTSLVIK